MRSLFLDLDGRWFADDESFQLAVIQAYNDRLWTFPTRYSYLDAIVAARRRGWLEQGATGVVVHASFADRATDHPASSSYDAITNLVNFER